MTDQTASITSIGGSLDKAMKEFDVLKEQMKSLASAIEIKEIEETNLESEITDLENVLSQSEPGHQTNKRLELELNDLEEEEAKLQQELLLCVPKANIRRPSGSSIASDISQGDLSQDLDEPNSELQNFERTMNEEINWEYPNAVPK